MKRITYLASVFVLAALVAACSGDDAESPADTGATEAITIAGFDFGGAQSVSVGDTVEVTNEDAVAHTWTDRDGAFDSGSLSTGDTFEFTFDEAGEFDYFCSIHPEMTGTISVSG